MARHRTQFIGALTIESAKKALDTDIAERERYTVVVAQAIHSIIRANDALTLTLLGNQAMRHDDAPRLFLEIIRLNKIPSKFADLRSIITSAILMKSKADYKGIDVSRKEAEKWIRNAEKYLTSAKEALEY